MWLQVIAMDQPVFITPMRQVSLDCRIDEALAIYEENALSGVYVRPSYPFPDLAPLRRFKGLKSLQIWHDEQFDLSVLRELHNLEYIGFGAFTKFKVDVSSLKHLRELVICWGPKTHFSVAMPQLQSLQVRGWKSPKNEIGELAEKFPNLETLCFDRPIFSNLNGVEKFSRLQKLRIRTAPKLTTISEIQGASALKTFELEGCKNIIDFPKVIKNQNILDLGYLGCGDIPNISFLNEMTNLRIFRFVDTNVLDGDLSPCLRLHFTGTLGKRHYKPPIAQIEAVNEQNKLRDG